MMIFRGMAWSAAAALALGSTAAYAGVVVVKSLGPSSKAYPPGKTLPTSAKITLQGGDVVTLLGPGAAKTLRGPGSFDTSDVGQASAAGQRGRFAAKRATDIVRNPSVWDVDATQSGKFCVTDAAKLKLWRPDSEGATKVTIRGADGQVQQLSWAAGKSVASWPAALPVTSGAGYQVEWPDGGDKSKLELVLVGVPPADLVEAAQLLIRNGCDNQLNLLVDGVSKDAK